ncbi:membrane metallo-endopeptidase-like 1 [Ceratina calcarata]|uniref:Membrane metallo-endopeptidase-like 1 n=1 Tax=Ceratina calcarata TaxID=156304 RepID=A0AAJ7JC41_9HYME|nr:membrane metallo-endopeptidase-like 1 [Ceratina calcarata]
MKPVIWSTALFVTFICSPCNVISNRLHSRSLEKPKAERSVCTTQECKELAKVLIESMNQTANPCEDFYEYACGNWAKHNPLPKGEMRWNLLAKAERIVDERLKEMFEEEAKPGEIYASRVAKRALKACLDTDKGEKEGLQPLISTMWRVGGWPLIMEENEWDEKMLMWQNVDDYYALLIGLNSFHDVHIDIDYLDGMKMNLMVKTPHLPYKIYSIYSVEETETDSSDENNDSKEGSQEPGSHERKDPEGSGESDDDDEDRYKVLRRIDSHKIHKRRNNKEHINDRKMKHYMKNSLHKSKRWYSETNNKKNKYEDEDMYFENTYNEKNNEVSEENDEENNNSKNSEDNESDGQDYSSSGDYGDAEDDSEDDADDDADDDTASKEADNSKEEAKKKVEKARKKYAEYMLNVSIALSEARGVPIPKEQLMKDIADLIKFQINIMKYSSRPGEMLNTTLQSFQEKYDSLERTSSSKVNWARKVQDLFSYGGMEIDVENDVAFISGYDYFKNLRNLLDTTPKRTLVNYIHWNFLSRVIKASTKKMRDLYYDWHGTPMDDAKKLKYCIDEIQAQYILGYEYVKRYFSDKILETALDMVADIQKEIEYEVKKASWMNDEVRHILLDKLVYMRTLIGYPDYVSCSLKNLLIYSLRSDPLIVNAFFSPFENAIEITAADFQKPFFDFKQPWYTNYATIGLIMGHEVNHGFDIFGRQTDKNGKVIEWSPEMTEEYEKRAKCFMDQFTKYSVVNNKTANIAIEDYGEQTAPENIADSMGLRVVYKAYQRRLRKCNEPDGVLPGLENLNNEQLFFLSFAYMWCEVADPEQLLKTLIRDSHSPGELRVIGPISNNEDFAKAYDCPLGSPMNPKKKCNLWE